MNAIIAAVDNRELSKSYTVMRTKRTMHTAEALLLLYCIGPKTKLGTPKSAQQSITLQRLLLPSYQKL
jgi:hypothetical protein